MYKSSAQITLTSIRHVKKATFQPRKSLKKTDTWEKSHAQVKNLFSIS